MKKYMNILKNSELFKNIDNLQEVIDTLKIKERNFKKGSFIYNYGDYMNSINIVVFGMVHIVKEDFWGNTSILTEIGVGELFGETYACLKNIPMQVRVEAVKDCVIYEIDTDSIINLGLIKNLLSVLAYKNFMLTNKLEAMSQKTIRDKVMTYLSQQSQKTKNNEFYIPFNRQQLADYLSIDRSALSREIANMKKDGLLIYNKNYFKLL
ncbi:MAG: Crp/Fnr family transcriptional regulator [Lachnospirales bacterium]